MQKKGKGKKLGAKVNELAVNSLLKQAREKAGKHSPQKKKEPTAGYAFEEIRNGRPYYYRRYYTTIDGKRVRKKEYLGTSLPKGMKIRGK